MAVSDPQEEQVPLTEAGALLVDCLLRDGTDRHSLLERLCREHPEQAAALRRLYEALADYGLVDEPQAQQLPPERLGPYRLLQTLGSGGMGTVYLAEHDELGRRVALKVIHAAMAHAPRARERFRREAIAASRLDHSAICTVYDVGSADGVPYLAMQHVAGETLDRRIATAAAAGRAMVDLPRSPDLLADDQVDAILHFAETLARALDIAHENGLVHRDVKPGNVMVTPDGEPVLLDFGLVRLEEGDEPSLSLSGDRLGTPLYMAPEQVAAGGAPADRRADVYSLGVLLYECLTLHPPFEAVNRQSLFQQILREEPTNPRQRKRRIGRDLWTVLQTAMAKEPDRRYRTARAFAEDLHRVRCREPIAARRAGPLLRLRRFAQRNPLVATFVVFLVVALVGAVFLLQSREAALRSAKAVGLARRAAEIGEVAPQLGLHLALAAAKAEHNLETISELYAAVIRSRERIRLLGHTAPLWGAEFSPMRDAILTWSGDNTARLWNLEGEQIAVMSHDRSVPWAAFAPDGRIVTASLDGTAAVWDRQGLQLAEMDHEAPDSSTSLFRAIAEPDSGRLVWWAGFSPDGKRVLTTCSDRRCYVWDTRTGEPLGKPFAGHSGPVGYGAWSPTDPDLAATCVDFVAMRPSTDRFEVLLWRPSTSVIQAKILDHGDSVHWVEFAPDGQTLLTASADGTARLWDLLGEEIEQFDHGARVWHARFSPDGDYIVTASEDGVVRVWDILSGHMLATARHDRAVFDARFVHDGERILTAGFDNSVRLFDRRGRELLSLQGHGDRVMGAAVSPDDRLFASASWDSTARIWSAQDEELPRLFHEGPVTAMAVGSDGTIVSVSDDGTARITDTNSLVSRTFRIDPRPVDVRLSPDGNRVLIGHLDSIARLRASRDGELEAEFELLTSPDMRAVFFVDGRIVTAARNGYLRRWSREGEPLGNLGRPHQSRAFALDSTDTEGGLLLSGGWHGNVCVTSSEGSLSGPWQAHESGVRAVAFSPDADRLASASNDQTVAILTLEGETLHRLRGHDGAVVAVAWSPDGDLLASGGSDGTARLWRASDGAPLAVLRGHKGAVNAVLFTPDGRLWTAGDDGAIQAWPVPRGATTLDALADALVELAEKRKVQRLTAEEEERFERVLAGR